MYERPGDAADISNAGKAIKLLRQMIRKVELVFASHVVIHDLV